MDTMEEIPEVPSRRPTDNESWGLYREQFRAVRDELIGYRNLFEKMKGGTLKTCFYVMDTGSDSTQVMVRDTKGETIIAVYSKKHFGKLKKGDMVLVAMDPMLGMAIVGRCPVQSATGDLMTLERFLPDSKVEVSNNGQREVYFCTEDLYEQIKDETVKPGSLLICLKGANIAFEAVPKPDGLNRLQYLLDEDVPRVTLDDMGAPPACLADVLKFFRLELTNPKIRRKYGARPLHTRLFDGPPGTGKTMGTQVIWRGMYDLIKSELGMDEKEIGRRVLKMKASQMLSMWVGESEKAFERFFDEAVEVAKKPVKHGKKEYILPILILIEEFDSMFRQRQGNTYDPIERIMTTALQRLDPINPDLSSGIICIIGTTNEPGLVDRAFLRRIGGKMDRFGMLTDKSFPKVLEKHLTRLPMASNNGTKQNELRTEAVDKLTHLLFTEDNKPVVEIEVHEKPDTIHKYRRDFLSGALVDRTVQEAATLAMDAEADGNGDGITVKQLAVALGNQVHSIVNQLSEQNAHKYMDLPDGDHVKKVKRV